MAFGNRRSAIGLAIVVAMAACKSGGATPPPNGDDAGDDDGGIPCDGTGISKGPWVVHVDETSAVVRWEACRAGTAPGLALAPEGGGTSTHVDSTETPVVIAETFRAFNSAAPPDYAGTWYAHEAKPAGLARGTCYRYTLDADASIGSSSSSSARFCTARAPGDSIHFLAIGDTNPALGDSTKNVLAHVVPKNFDFAIHGGDIEYYDSFIETWALWFPVMAPLLRQGAILPAIGNHDVGGKSGEPADKWTEYTARFFGGAGFDGTDSHYRFESGGVWFFAIDTEDALDPASVQYQWLTSELQNASQQPGYRFSVVYMHRPFLTCGDTGDDTGALQPLTPIFDQYKVPLVVQAHMHGYERFELPGRTFVTAAGGGGAIHDVNANASRSYCNQRVASGAFFHGVVFDVTPGKLAGTVIDDQGNVRDQFTHAVP